MQQIFVTYLRARCLPLRLAALAVTALLGATIARAPAPAVRVDLEAATYPAVLVGALVPVLIGALAVAPAPVRLGWLTAAPTPRAWILRSVEFTLVITAACAAAAICGAPAQLGVAAVQNALVTMVAAGAFALLVGAGAATAVVGTAAVLMLLASPGMAGELWIVIDTQPDGADWLALGTLALIAAALMITVRTRGRPASARG